MNAAEEIALFDVSIIKPEEIAQNWLEVVPMLDRVNTDGYYNMKDIYDRLLDGRQTLITIRQDGELVACSTITIMNYPQKRTLAGVLLAGERMGEWSEVFIEHLRMMARHIDAEEIEFGGRKGFEKALNGSAKVSSVRYIIEV